jgi:hypothetical protein
MKRGTGFYWEEYIKEGFNPVNQRYGATLLIYPDTLITEFEEI